MSDGRLLMELLDLVHGNTTLQLRAFFSEAEGYLTRWDVVEVRIMIWRFYFHRRNRVPSHDYLRFFFPLSDVFSNQNRDARVGHMVSLVGHPDQDDVQFWNRQISSFALNAARAAVDEGHTEFLLETFIDITMDEADEAFGAAESTMHDVVMISSGGRGGFGGVPASRSPINALQTRRFEGVQGHDQSSRLTCVICLEDFEVGAEVTALPCSHEFHHTCLSQWLERSHLCPVCRFSMPTMDS